MEHVTPCAHSKLTQPHFHTKSTARCKHPSEGHGSVSYSKPAHTQLEWNLGHIKNNQFLSDFKSQNSNIPMYESSFIVNVIYFLHPLLALNCNSNYGLVILYEGYYPISFSSHLKFCKIGGLAFCIFY